MKKVVTVLMTIWIVSSCATIPTTSRFDVISISIGIHKEDILKEFGRPFMYDIYIKEGKSIEVLYYKEPVRVATCPYIVTTTLYFENSILQKFTQKDRLIKDFEIHKDSIK